MSGKALANDDLSYSDEYTSDDGGDVNIYVNGQKGGAEDRYMDDYAEEDQYMNEEYVDAAAEEEPLYDEDEQDNYGSVANLGNQALSVGDFSRTEVETRRIKVELRGALKEFTTSSSKSQWKIDPSREENAFLSKVNGQFQGDLSQVLILDAKCVQVKNTFPVDVSLNLSGLGEGLYAAKNGNRSHVEILAKTQSQPVNISIYHPRDLISKNARANFKAVKPDTLKNDIIGDKATEHLSKDKQLCLLPDDSLIVETLNLEENRQQLGLPFLQGDKTGYVKIKRAIAEAAADALMKPIMETKQKLVNLREFSATWNRSDGQNQWASPENVGEDMIAEDMTDFSGHKDKKLTNQYVAVAVIEIQYVPHF